MITIPVRVCGDVWCDPTEFCAALRATDPQQSLAIDLGAEGPSIEALGILAELRKHCQTTGRDIRSIRLINSPNNIEITEFKNTHQGCSHFFDMSTRYWRPAVRPGDLANRFAMFVGRTTVARCSMMYQISHDAAFRSHFKLSTMDHDASPIWNPYPGWRVIERLEHWMDAAETTKMIQWWNTARPPSLDGKKVRDQYSPAHNTNLSILDHYVHFHIELVAETYTLGRTFFPTEKTVRPIMAARPLLVYAAPGFLSHLRDLGFRTYHDIWDEDYDCYQGPERWRKIKTVIARICSMDIAQFHDLMQSAADISWHNRRVLADMCLTNKTVANEFSS